MMRPRLIEARKNSGLQVADIASRIGVKVRAYRYYETGKINPSLKVATKLEQLFNVPVTALLMQDSNTDAGASA